MDIVYIALSDLAFLVAGNQRLTAVLWMSSKERINQMILQINKPSQSARIHSAWNSACGHMMHCIFLASLVQTALHWLPYDHIEESMACASLEITS